MKPHKADRTCGDTLDYRGFNHSERNYKNRRIMFKKANKRFLKQLDKSINKDNYNQ